MLDDIKGDVCEALTDLCELYENGNLRDPELEAATPAKGKKAKTAAGSKRSFPACHWESRLDAISSACTW